MNKEAVVSIVHGGDGSNVGTAYATGKAVNLVDECETKEVVRVYGKEKIVYLGMGKWCDRMLTYALSNGAIFSTAAGESQTVEFEQISKEEGHNSFTGAVEDESQAKCLLFGKGVPPMIVDKEKSVTAWKGKNVKHDELDL